MIRVDSEMDCVTTKYRSAGIVFAWRLQKLFCEGLQIIDETYTVKIDIQGFVSAADLEVAMDKMGM